MAHLSENQRPIVPEVDADLYNDAVDGAVQPSGSSTESLASSILNYQYEGWCPASRVADTDGSRMGDDIMRIGGGSTCFPTTSENKDGSPFIPIFVTSRWGEHYIERLSNQTYSKSLIWGREPENGPGHGRPLFKGHCYRLPPNCRFEIDDFELEWNYSHPFDYIHMRGIEGPVRDFHRLFKQAHNNLNPGGWFEICDFTVGTFSDDDSAEKATSLQQWRDILVEASKKFGKQFSVAQNYKQWMIDAGFKDAREEVYKVPFSPWAKDPKLKDLGRFQQANVLEALDAYSLALMTRFLRWTVEEVQVLLTSVRKELLDRKLHIYSWLYVVFGRRE